METLLVGGKHLTRKGDYMFPFDLHDGFYALGIAEQNRDYITVDHPPTRYIRYPANVWADYWLSKHLDSDDWQLDPDLFAEMDSRFRPHSIDRFASALNAMLPRYNAA
eukprot:jgi/Tetstr1/428022/TSEL_000167.t1